MTLMNTASRIAIRGLRQALLSSKVIPIVVSHSLTTLRCKRLRNYTTTTTEPPRQEVPLHEELGQDEEDSLEGAWRTEPFERGWGPGPVKIPEEAEVLPHWFDQQTGRTFTIAWYERGFIIAHSDTGIGYEYHPTQLRDGCTCKFCRDPSSGNKTFSSTDIPTGIIIKSVKGTPDEGLLVRVKRDLSSSSNHSHLITLSPEWLRGTLARRTDKTPPTRRNIRRRFGVEHWDRDSFAARAHKIDYEEYMAGGTRFWDAIRDLARFGLVFLKNVPQDEQSVVRVTERIANIRETFYGRTFDVKAKPQAENVAYTSAYLGLHQDLLYLNPSPQIQILHCMENSCKGGESLFSDGDRIARILWQLREQVPVSNLVHIGVPFGYDKNGHRYGQFRRILNSEPLNVRSFGNFYWSPPFQGEFRRPLDMYRWIKGAQIFESMINDPRSVYKTKMSPGDCVLFDNLRVLHGRTAFDPSGGGSRWLRGTYISGEDFYSTASHAPATHAVPLTDPENLWDEQLHMLQLGATPLYKEIVEKVKAAQNDIMAHQIAPSMRGHDAAREEQHKIWMQEWKKKPTTPAKNIDA